MSTHYVENEEHTKIYKSIANRELLEEKALATLTSDILNKLDVNIERFPLKCRTLLNQVAESQSTLELQAVDPISISLYRSKELSGKLEDEYEILKLTQKNKELQARIDRNNRFIAKLRRDLEWSKQGLFNQNPNPNNIQDFMRQMKQKLTTYEENYEIAKKKYSGLNIPEAILPKALNSQITCLQKLQEEAILLNEQVNDVLLIQETKSTISRLWK